ncbi:agmatinase [Mycolicibacterium sp. 050158]|uniref:agmatinase n=1 Tax=Mycolicibacterium sp. 050158 TaxID=3090602 RepID=UPI00299F36B7|nr:agmatinase [Mycolicibacterium sp. 050158]MDX1888475.1 agmatinase [Mycolicibacterium sp. 050158]
MNDDTGAGHGITGQADGQAIPRYAGLTTFARLPRREDVPRYDVAVVGIPFDSGVTYRPGARFGPSHIRQASRLLRPYNPELRVSPFANQQVVDAGDMVANPFDIAAAVAEIDEQATELISTGARLVTLGGDHTIAYPLLRAHHRRYGPVALLHFDAHLDTWDTYFEAPVTHGTPFRRAAEEGLFVPGHSAHVGIRGSLYDPGDLIDDAGFGFTVVHCTEFERRTTDDVVDQLRATIGDRPLYVSIDIDVLDPAHAPATGTPEAGGMTSRELLAILRGLVGCDLVGADVVEVSPAYDHAEITGVAAANVAYELISLLARRTAS